MTKIELAEMIQAVTGMTKKDSAETLEAFFTIMKSTLESGEIIKVSGFGNFEVKRKHARKGRNPQTGEVITIEERRILTFKPGSVLKHLFSL